jgi:hypothetical protein
VLCCNVFCVFALCVCFVCVYVCVCVLCACMFVCVFFVRVCLCVCFGLRPMSCVPVLQMFLDCPFLTAPFWVSLAFL